METALGRWAPSGLVERLLVRVGVRDHVARLLAATPSLRASWLTAGGAVIGFSAWAAHSGPRGELLFLVVTPLVPVAGVAAAYGAWMDPMHEMTHATPTPGIRIVLLRATAVLVSTGLVVGAATLLLPGVTRETAAWILPSLALSVCCITLSTFVPAPWAAGGVTLLWLTVVLLAGTRWSDRFAVFRGPGQIAFFVAIVGSSMILARRRERFEVAGRARQRRLIDAADAERRRIERNIHDGAQQQLVAIGVKLGLVKKLIRTDPARAVALVEGLQEDAREALQSLRDMTRGSRPPILADSGLGAALELSARKAPIPVVVAAEGLPRFAEDIETAVYFCCLEAIQNASKYAGASEATVSVRSLGADLSFTVADDGLGFDPETVQRGVGLRSMAERTEALGGSIEIRSAPGSGTVVVGRIPLPA